MRNLLLVTAVIWLANWGILVTRSYALGTDNGLSEAIIRLLVSIAGGLSCILIFKMLQRSQQPPLPRFLTAVGLSIPIALAVAVIYESLWLFFTDYYFVRKGIRLATIDFSQCGVASSACVYLVREALFTTGTLFWVYVSWCALYVGMAIAGELRERDIRLNVAERTAKDAQLSALRLQLNPHFLFNTLNTLSGLIALDRKRQAEDMVLNLSSFLRFSLKSGEEELVTVAKEIDAQKMKRPIRFCCGGSFSAAPFMRQSFFDCPTHCRASSVASIYWRRCNRS